jgi:predicted outer membrane lipoprotein
MKPPPPLPSSLPPSVASMPLFARMMNVFAIPGDVFEDVRQSPNNPGSWLLPVLLACAVGVVSAVILFSQPAILEEMRAMRAKAMQHQVEAGKMTQAQADRVLEAVERFTRPTFMKISGAVGAMVISFARVFWWAFALWLLALIFVRVRIPYLKALETTGLASLIGTLGMVVTLLLQINLGRSTATPSLALAVSDFDPGNKMHMVMGALNLIQVWMVLVMGVGLAKLSGIPFSRAALLVLGCYLLQTSALVLMGAGMAAL